MCARACVCTRARVFWRGKGGGGGVLGGGAPPPFIPRRVRALPLDALAFIPQGVMDKLTSLGVQETQVAVLGRL